MWEEKNMTTNCANCGKAENDDVQLKPCDKCDSSLVRYCSGKCQRAHSQIHKKSCNQWSALKATAAAINYAWAHPSNNARVTNSNVLMGATVASADRCCTNCGKAEIDDIELKDCENCDLARYCGEDCQQDHREVHEAICKVRAAELLRRDEILFRQPESSHLGDCPICCIPIRHPKGINDIEYLTMDCCCKEICLGCGYGHLMGQMQRQNESFTCPYCRQVCILETKEIGDRCRKSVKRGADASDSHAMWLMGLVLRDKGDCSGAVDYLLKSAELGHAEAHDTLSEMYRDGNGVEKDEKKELYHLEEAAIAGNMEARYTLAMKEGMNKRHGRKVKHLIINANLGHDNSMQKLKECYRNGQVSKEELAAALRAHQAAIDATKSPQREEAKNLLKSAGDLESSGFGRWASFV